MMVRSTARWKHYGKRGIHMGRLNDLALSARVKQVMIGVLDLGMSADQLADDTSLYSSALQMDSLTLLHLLLALEKEFGVVIDDEDVMNADLETVASLIGIVRRAADGRTSDAGV